MNFGEDEEPSSDDGNVAEQAEECDDYEGQTQTWKGRADAAEYVHHAARSVFAKGLLCNEDILMKISFHSTITKHNNRRGHEQRAEDVENDEARSEQINVVHQATAIIILKCCILDYLIRKIIIYSSSWVHLLNFLYKFRKMHFCMRMMQIRVDKNLPHELNFT